MRRILGLLATGCLALTAGTASAIPLHVDVLTVGTAAFGDWNLSGPTDASGSWGGVGLGYQSWDLDIAAGDYLWQITGEGYGLARVIWSLDVAGSQLFVGSDRDYGWGFRLYDDQTFTALPTQVPEPGVLLLLGGGLIALATIGRRKAARA